MRVSAVDEERFRVLYEAHYPAILRYAQRRMAGDVATDVAAEVFVVAWRRLTSVPDVALPWLYAVTRRIVANQRRGAERALRLTDRLAIYAGSVRDFGPGADPGETVPSSAMLAAAFDALSADDREVLALVVWEGLGAKDAATVLACSVPAVTMRLHRARHRLRAALASESEEN